MDLPGFALTEQQARALARQGDEFLADFYECALARRPGESALCFELANVCTALGRYERGLALDRELVRREPENETYRFNLACSLALTGDTPAALDELERAVELGYDDLEHLLADRDLERLRGEARFRELVARLRAELGGPEELPDSAAAEDEP